MMHVTHAGRVYIVETPGAVFRLLATLAQSAV